MKKVWLRLGSVLLVVAMLMTVLLSVQAVEVEPAVTISGCNLSFSDTIYIKYAVSFKNAAADDIKMLIWLTPCEEYVAGTEDTTVACDGTQEVDGKTYAIFAYKGLAAKQMTDDVYARAYVEKSGTGYYSAVKKYSILQYAYNKLGKTGTATDDESLKDLLNGMLSYGALAQKHFNYKTNHLATDAFVQIRTQNGTLADGCNTGLFKKGETVALCAPEQDKDGNAFAYWKDGTGAQVGTAAEMTVSAGSANATYTAVYSVPTAGLEIENNEDGTTCTVAGLADGCTDTDIVLPAVYNGRTVTDIDAKAFMGEEITSITIPGTVQTIGSKAFNNCDELTDVYYQGTKEQWGQIDISTGNTPLTKAEIHYLGEPTFTVTFTDHDGTVLKTEAVYSGEDATPPADPTREGYTFTGWEGNYTAVTQDETVTATYEVAVSGVIFRFTCDEAKIGEDVLVTLSVESDDASSVNGLLAYNLEYDESVADFAGFTDCGELVTGSIAGNDSVADGIVNLGYYPAIVANGKICQLRFTLKDGVSAGTQFTVSMKASASNDGNPISTVIEPSCTVTISN